MSSTETVNLDRVISRFRKDPQISEADKDLILEFINAIAAEGISEVQQRKYIYSFKCILLQFAPDDFQFGDASEQDLRQVMAEVHRSDYATSTKQNMAVSIKRLYKWLNDGEYPDKVDFITTTRKKDKTVKREDLFTEAERKQLFNEFRNLRDRAFFKTLYESAARPGELMNCSIADVEFNEKGDFIHLEGAKGTPDRTNQLIEAGQILREWLENHPAGGDIYDPRDASAPLWVKQEQTSCRHCGETQQTHEDSDCTDFDPVEYEQAGYSLLYRAFKRACDRAGIEGQRPYNFRHTRITEVSQFMSHEQLCKFAGWVPGSNRAKVYVHLTNDDVNRAIREEYGLRTEDVDEMVTCQVCGQKNDGGSFECRNCRRPLNLEKAEKKEQMEKAVEIYNRIEQDGGLEKLEKLETLVDNADAIEELVEG